MAEKSPSAEAQSRGYEIADINVRAFVWGALAVLITMVASAYIGYVLLDASAPAYRGIADFEPPAAKTRADLPRPPQSAEALAREQEALLNGYGWIDEEAGIAHISIERAMELISNGGLPEFEARTARKQNR